LQLLQFQQYFKEFLHRQQMDRGGQGRRNSSIMPALPQDGLVGVPDLGFTSALGNGRCAGGWFGRGSGS
jgi:hypothetical protein